MAKKNKSTNELRKEQKISELKQEKKATRKLRRQQFWQTFKSQTKQDKKLIPLMIAFFIGSWFVTILLSKYLLNNMIFGIIFGIFVGLIVTLFFFGRRMQSNIYKQVEGNIGAAGWLLDNLRGKWASFNSIATNSSFDVVHLLIGKPGVILVGEGNSGKIDNLLNQEKKKISRVVGSTPIYTLKVGNNKGEVRLGKLENYIKKLPKNIDNATISSIQTRFTTLTKNGMPLPKGPMPGAAMRGKSIQRTAKRKTR